MSQKNRKFLLAVCMFAGCSSALGNLADTLSGCAQGGELPTKMFVRGCEVSPCTVRNGTIVEMTMVYYPREKMSTYYTC